MADPKADPKLRKPTLSSVAKGALEARFQRAWHDVLENIGDDNTDARAARTITLTLTCKPSEDRKTLSMRVASKVKLPGITAAETSFYLGRVAGALVGVENNPDQLQLFDPEESSDEKPAAEPAASSAPAPAAPSAAGGPLRAVEGGRS